jgi:vacuolar-type H+-ATPase subunit H
MKQENIREEVTQSNPQVALEKVLSAEIDIAEKVSNARERAEKTIGASQNDVVALKEKILSDARTKRDAAIKQGVAHAHEEAQKTIAAAQADAKKTIENGRQYLDEAVGLVMDLLIGLQQEDGK